MRARLPARYDDTVAGNLFRRATLFRTGNRYGTLPLLTPPTVTARAIYGTYLRQGVYFSAQVEFPLESLTRTYLTRVFPRATHSAHVSECIMEKSCATMRPKERDRGTRLIFFEISVTKITLYKPMRAISKKKKKKKEDKN